MTKRLNQIHYNKTTTMTKLLKPLKKKKSHQNQRAKSSKKKRKKSRYLVESLQPNQTIVHLLRPQVAIE